MDYRNRRYFLVEFNHVTRNLRLRNMRLADPSVKCHPPYNHITYGHYDGEYSNMTGLRFPSIMLTCSRNKADAVLYELRKMVREDHYSGYYELSEFECWQ